MDFIDSQKSDPPFVLLLALSHMHCRKVFVHCMIKADCPAYEVQHLLFETGITHGGMYDVERCINLKCHINRGKVLGSTLKISHFMGCEMLSSQHLDVI